MFQVGSVKFNVGSLQPFSVFFTQRRKVGAKDFVLLCALCVFVVQQFTSFIVSKFQVGSLRFNVGS
jgi:hypothetical protein